MSQHRAHATTTRYGTNAATTGYGAHAATTGDCANAATTGDWANAATTGERAHAATTGYGANATTTGHGAHAATTGYGAHATTTRCGANAATTGQGANAATTGYGAHAATTGHGAHAATTGYEAHAVAIEGMAEARSGIAIGRWVRLDADRGCGVVMPDTDGYQPHVVAVADGWTPGVWITMTNGTVEEHPDVLLPDDGRGYMLTVTDDGRYVAGCRDFTYDEAAAHWSNPDHEAPEFARRLLAEVQRHHKAVTS